jgi:hypothetical protein
LFTHAFAALVPVVETIEDEVEAFRVKSKFINCDGVFHATVVDGLKP